jgi:hypothetical protein
MNLKNIEYALEQDLSTTQTSHNAGGVVLCRPALETLRVPKRSWFDSRGEDNMKETLWKKWFAWHPVLLEDGRRVWLRSVQRRWFNDALWYREIPNMDEY